jgi:hypothetical protein
MAHRLSFGWAQRMRPKATTRGVILQTHLDLQKGVHSLFQGLHPAGQAVSAAPALAGRVLHVLAQLGLQLRDLALQPLHTAAEGWRAVLTCIRLHHKTCKSSSSQARISIGLTYSSGILPSNLVMRSLRDGKLPSACIRLHHDKPVIVLVQRFVHELRPLNSWHAGKNLK